MELTSPLRSVNAYRNEPSCNVYSRAQTRSELTQTTAQHLYCRRKERFASFPSASVHQAYLYISPGYSPHPSSNLCRLQTHGQEGSRVVWAACIMWHQAGKCLVVASGNRTSVRLDTARRVRWLFEWRYNAWFAAHGSVSYTDGQGISRVSVTHRFITVSIKPGHPDPRESIPPPHSPILWY
jgi:hypothetical protein